MLIDLTRKPLILYPEESPNALVVRSIGNKQVNGLVSYVTDADNVSRRRRDLKPGAEITRGSNTLYETRVPIPGAKMADSPYEESHQARWRREDRQRHAQAIGIPEAKEKVEILPEPFEVASVYTDILTSVTGTWRAGIRVEFISKMKAYPWVVSVIDATTGVTLSSVAVSGLDPNPEIRDPLPLTRAIQRTARPANAWTRVLDDDTE